MQKLMEGVHEFRKSGFGRYRELFQRLSHEGQKPHSLFITCSDSRVLAELITHSRPGDLFVVKNMGNIVPPSNATGSTNSTSAAIEFAVESLGVKDIVVCGHSQCGAIAALMHGIPTPETMPHLSKWIGLAQPVREIVEGKYQHLTDPEDRLRAAEEENVLFSIENLQSYPCVARRLADQLLHVHGWFFKIATAELFAFDPAVGQFVLLETP